MSWWKALDLDAAYIEYLVGQGLSDATVTLYAQRLAVAVRWADNRGVTLLDASPSVIRAYAKECVQFSHSSRGQAVAVLRHYWEWKGRINPPYKAIRVPPQPDMVCRAVDDDQARDLVKMALGWHPKGLAVLFGLYLALRRTEIAAAEWARFSTDMGWYTVTGKGDKTATLPVHQMLQDELADRGEGYVFPGRFGGHVSPATIWEWTKTVAVEAGIHDFSTHQLRHTALTTANDTLGDLRAVQTFARHKKPETTAGYTRTKQTRLREVSDSLDYL